MTQRFAGRPSATGPPCVPAIPAMAAGCQLTARPAPTRWAVELGEGERQRRLEAEHPWRRLVERRLLAVRFVRGVVGGDGVDLAVGQCPAHGRDVGLGSQRRVHLEDRVVVDDTHSSVRVKWWGATSAVTGRPSRLERGDHGQRPGGRQVQEVDAGAGQADEGDVALRP